MATTSLTIGNELLSTTMHVLAKEYRDGLSTKVGFLDAVERVHGKGNPSQDGGTRLVCPVVLQVHSNVTRLQTGYEEIDLSFKDVSVPAVYDWGSVVMPVGISSEEEIDNSGESAILKIVEMRVEATMEEMRRQWCKHMVQGGVSGWDDWNTLNGTDNPNGFIEEVAAASQAATVGGISKASYTTSTGWVNPRFDGAASFNSNGLNGLYDLRVEIDSVASGPSFKESGIILASRAGFKNLKRALQANERYVDQAAIDGGRMVELWDGIRIDVEYYMPDAGGSPGTTTDPWSFLFVNAKDIHPVWSKGGGKDGFFGMDDFETVSGNFDVRASKIRCRGQLVAKHLGTSGIAYDLETF